MMTGGQVRTCLNLVLFEIRKKYGSIVPTVSKESTVSVFITVFFFFFGWRDGEMDGFVV